MGFGWATAAWQIWVPFGLYGLYFGLVEGSERALIAGMAAKEARGAAFGWYNAAIGIAALPASGIFGLLWHRAGPRLAFGCGAILALMAAILLLAPQPQPGEA